jgi:SAM-dependent methyltransferase
MRVTPGGITRVLERIVEHLICPETGAPLRLEVHQRAGDEILEGELISQTDEALRYSVRRGVPRFVNAEHLREAQRATVEAFAYKWARIPQYAHERATKAHRERWYFQRFGFTDGDADLRRFLTGARFVLEAGTGTGVDTDLLARNFGGLLFGVDISSAIDTAYERFRDNPRVALLQADIGRLPFRPGFFDVISCDQVLHHTPDPAGNFRRLAALLAPGGRFLLYVYKVKGPLREFADDYLRGLMTRAPVEACLTFSEKMARLGRNLSRLHATVEIEEDIPELDLRRGTYDVQRLIYDHILKCFWNADYDFITNTMVNFDWYRPQHAFRYTEAEVRGWAEAEQLELQHLDVSPSGISVILRAPASRSLGAP